MSCPGVNASFLNLSCSFISTGKGKQVYSAASSLEQGIKMQVVSLMYSELYFCCRSANSSSDRSLKRHMGYFQKQHCDVG